MKRQDNNLIFKLLYIITSLNKVKDLELICQKIFNKYLEYKNSDLYTALTYFHSIDQVFAERYGPIMMKMHLQRILKNKKPQLELIELLSYIDAKQENRIKYRKELKDLIQVRPIRKKP